MLRVAQECFSGRLGCEHARLSFDAKLELKAADTGNEADDGLRKVDVEIVADNGPVCGGSGAAEQVAEKPREILFRPGIAYDAFDLAGGDVESGDRIADRALAVGVPPPLAPIPRRLRPDTELPCALAHLHPLDRM